MANDPSSDNNAKTRVVDGGAPLALSAGTLLGRYRIDGVLGQGGFGITYRATDTALNRAVAIKEYLPSDVAIRIDGSTVIPRSRTDADDYDWGLKRFLDEAKTLAQHEAVPNVVRVYDFVEANGTAYMIMALVEGDNLSSILRQRGTLNEQELRAVALPLLDGLEQLHESGLIHRDIKPGNIILRIGRGPTLIDFGAAREGLGRKSRSVTSILTPGYAPFEQYGSAGDQGPWTDIYALAATLYHGVAGKAPPDSVDRIRRDPMVPAVQAGAGRYSETFLAAIDAGLKVDERERPQNAAQWRELFGGVPLQAMARATVQPANVAPAAPSPASSRPSQTIPSQRPGIEPAPPPSVMSPPPAARAGSRGRIVIAAGAAVLLIGGGVAALGLGGGASKPDSVQAPRPDSASVQLAAAEKERIDAETRRTADLEKRLADEEARRKAAEEAQAKVLAEAEKRRLAEEEARRKAAEDARLKAETEAREKAEAENRRRIEEDTRKKVEAEFKARAEEEARKRKTEEENKNKVEEARLKAEEAKRKAEEARQKVDDARTKAEQKSGAAPQVAAAPAAAPPADPAAYVAQHWSVMRPQVEAALRQRGLISDPASSSSMRFDQIVGYRVVRATADTIVVVVTARFTRGTPNFGVAVGANADFIETATFRNQAPTFPMSSLQSAGNAGTGAAASAAQTGASQMAAAQPPEDAAAYVAQHWPAMRPQVEKALTGRGVFTDTASGVAMRVQSVNSYQLVSVTPSTVTLRVNYTNVRAVPGGGNMTGSVASYNETATFQNQPPSFPLVSIK